MTVNILGTQSSSLGIRRLRDSAVYPCIGEACVGYHVGICLRAHEALKEVKEDGKITYNRRICETSV